MEEEQQQLMEIGHGRLVNTVDQLNTQFRPAVSQACVHLCARWGLQAPEDAARDLEEAGLLPQEEAKALFIFSAIPETGLLARALLASVLAVLGGGDLVVCALPWGGFDPFKNLLNAVGASFRVRGLRRVESEGPPRGELLQVYAPVVSPREGHDARPCAVVLWNLAAEKGAEQKGASLFDLAGWAEWCVEAGVEPFAQPKDPFASDLDAGEDVLLAGMAHGGLREARRDAVRVDALPSILQQQSDEHMKETIAGMQPGTVAEIMRKFACGIQGGVEGKGMPEGLRLLPRRDTGAQHVLGQSPVRRWCSGVYTSEQWCSQQQGQQGSSSRKELAKLREEHPDVPDEPFSVFLSTRFDGESGTTALYLTRDPPAPQQEEEDEEREEGAAPRDWGVRVANLRGSIRVSRHMEVSPTLEEEPGSDVALFVVAQVAENHKMRGVQTDLFLVRRRLAAVEGALWAAPGRTDTFNPPVYEGVENISVHPDWAMVHMSTIMTSVASMRHDSDTLFLTLVNRTPTNDMVLCRPMRDILGTELHGQQAALVHQSAHRVYRMLAQLAGEACVGRRRAPELEMPWRAALCDVVRGALDRRTTMSHAEQLGTMLGPLMRCLAQGTPLDDGNSLVTRAEPNAALWFEEGSDLEDDPFVEAQRKVAAAVSAGGGEASSSSSAPRDPGQREGALRRVAQVLRHCRMALHEALREHILPLVQRAREGAQAVADREAARRYQERLEEEKALEAEKRASEEVEKEPEAREQVDEAPRAGPGEEEEEQSAEESSAGSQGEESADEEEEEEEEEHEEEPAEKEFETLEEVDAFLRERVPVVAKEVAGVLARLLDALDAADAGSMCRAAVEEARSTGVFPSMDMTQACEISKVEGLLQMVVGCTACALCYLSSSQDVDFSARMQVEGSLLGQQGATGPFFSRTHEMCTSVSSSAVESLILELFQELLAPDANVIETLVGLCEFGDDLAVSVHTGESPAVVRAARLREADAAAVKKKKKKGKRGAAPRGRAAGEGSKTGVFASRRNAYAADAERVSNKVEAKTEKKVKGADTAPTSAFTLSADERKQAWGELYKGLDWLRSAEMSRGLMAVRLLQSRGGECAFITLLQALTGTPARRLMSNSTAMAFDGLMRTVQRAGVHLVHAAFKTLLGMLTPGFRPLSGVRTKEIFGGCRLSREDAMGHLLPEVVQEATEVMGCCRRLQEADPEHKKVLPGDIVFTRHTPCYALAVASPSGHHALHLVVAARQLRRRACETHVDFFSNTDCQQVWSDHLVEPTVDVHSRVLRATGEAPINLRCTPCPGGSAVLCTSGSASKQLQAAVLVRFDRVEPKVRVDSWFDHAPHVTWCTPVFDPSPQEEPSLPRWRMLGLSTGGFLACTDVLSPAPDPKEGGDEGPGPWQQMSFACCSELDPDRWAPQRPEFNLVFTWDPYRAIFMENKSGMTVVEWTTAA